MNTGLPTATKSEKRRFEIIKREIGCIACRHDGDIGVWSDAHHLLSGGRRISHLATIPLCPLHHRGYDCDRDGIAKMYVPSVADSIRDFRLRYGTDQFLLDKTNRLVAAFEANTIGGGG